MTAQLQTQIQVPGEDYVRPWLSESIGHFVCIVSKLSQEKKRLYLVGCDLLIEENQDRLNKYHEALQMVIRSLRLLNSEMERSRRTAEEGRRNIRRNYLEIEEHGEWHEEERTTWYRINSHILLYDAEKRKQFQIEEDIRSTEDMLICVETYRELLQY